jgi:hypothetical protein
VNGSSSLACCGVFVEMPATSITFVGFGFATGGVYCWEWY